MRLRRFLRPLILVMITAGVAFATYSTRDSWKPHVFPTEPAAKGEGHGGAAKEEEPKDRVTLSEQAQLNLQLDAQQQSPREYWRTILLPGAVVDLPGESDRGVTSRVGGVVIAILARPGDMVKPGDPLFTLQLVSELLLIAQSDLFKSAGELRIASEKRDRIALQVKQNTTAGAVLIDEENQVKRITAQVEAHRRHLLNFGLVPEQISRAERGDVVTEVTVAAPGRNGSKPPIGGSASEPAEPLYELQDLKVRLGDQVLAGQSLCTLADHQRLFVEGWAFKSEARSLATAAEKRLPIRAEFTDEHDDWPPIETLLIHHLANQVDPVSRTFSFFMTLENQSQNFVRDGKTFFVWRFRPGQRVRLRVPVEKLATPGADGKTDILPFVLPTGAVVREGPEAFVFVQSGDVFIRKTVRVLYEDRTDVVVANDGKSITEADFVVRNEAAAINRALKAASGGGDEH